MSDSHAPERPPPITKASQPIDYCTTVPLAPLWASVTHQPLIPFGGESRGAKMHFAKNHGTSACEKALYICIVVPPFGVWADFGA